MGKASKLRKKTRAASAAIPYTSPAVAKAIPPTPPTDDDTSLPDADDAPEIDPVDIEITISTLEQLLKRPSFLKAAEQKPLRTLIHKLHAATGIGAAAGNFNPETELIAALRNRDHPRARALLATIKTPKLGSLQRWVRECDAANVPDPKNPDGYEEQQRETWKTLEMIIRTTMGQTETSSKETLTRFPPWEVEHKDDGARLPYYRMVKEGRIASLEEAKHFESNFKILTTIPAAERKPPNLYPAILWTSNPASIPTPLSDGPVVKHTIRDIPNAIILRNVLSPTTCRRIIAAAETLGFTPDQAVSGSATELASVLAHNFYWVADEAFNNALFERVKPHLPPTVNGCPIRTINRRYRTYRYVPGSVYRPHVDGAWPPSGITPDGEYVYDITAGQETRQYSRFTFLVYLNDEFKGGETTFFVPGEKEEGLCARPVRPEMGSVVVFPHGDTNGSLVHEGTGVSEGAKYIIRTDVVYEVPKMGRAAKTVS